MANTNQKTNRAPKNGRGAKQDRNYNRKPKHYEEGDETKNDVSWYTQAGNLVENAGSVSFFDPVGNGIRNWSGLKKGEGQTFPGIMTINFLPGPGKSVNQASAVNIAATNQLEFIRNHNSGGKIYNKENLIMYLLAMDSAYMLYAMLVRALGVCRTWSQTNRYFPLGLLKAMHFNADPTDPNCIINNLSDFRMLINVMVSRLSQFPVPNNMSIFSRHAWLCSNYFIDHPTTKAQLYVYVPRVLYVYDEFSEPAKLKARTLFDTELDMSNIPQLIEEIVSAIVSSDDMGYIGGDILKAYGTAGLLTLSQVDATYELLPAYNPEVLEQIQNIKGFWTMVDYNSLDITEDPNLNGGALLYDPWFLDTPFPDSDGDNEEYEYDRPGWWLGQKGVMINAHVDSPTPENVMVMTRFVPGVPTEYSYDEVSGIGKFKLSSFGTEIVDFLEITRTDYTNNVFKVIREGVNLVYANELDNTDITVAGISIEHLRETLFKLNEVRHFDWHPAITVLTSYGINSGDTEVYDLFQYWETDNYTVIDSNVRDKLNDAAVLSEWQIPVLGTLK